LARSSEVAAGLWDPRHIDRRQQIQIILIRWMRDQFRDALGTVAVIVIAEDFGRQRIGVYKQHAIRLPLILLARRKMTIGNRLHGLINTMPLSQKLASKLRLPCRLIMLRQLLAKRGFAGRFGAIEAYCLHEVAPHYRIEVFPARKWISANFGSADRYCRTVRIHDHMRRSQISADVRVVRGLAGKAGIGPLTARVNDHALPDAVKLMGRRTFLWKIWQRIVERHDLCRGVKLANPSAAHCDGDGFTGPVRYADGQPLAL
jgi:hypothetical protein